MENEETANVLLKEGIIKINDENGVPQLKSIEELKEKEILKKDIFEQIFILDDPAEREQIILKFQERAENLKIGPSFKKVLRQYEKQYQKQNMSLKQTHNEVSKMLLEQNNIVLYENDLFIYKDGVYSRDEMDIERKVIEIIPEATSYFRAEVCKNLKLRLKPDSPVFDRESNIINFKNGLFDINKRELIEHKSSFFSINQINTNYNPNAEKVKVIDDVLNKLSNGIEIRKQTILEMIGYCMTTSVKLQKAFILYGETARNGKSTLINIITELIGSENVGSVPFREISKNKFAGAGIKGKILNIGAEMTDEYIDDVSNFKMYITGDEVEIEEKFKPRQKIKPYAKFIFNANELPSVADKTNAFYRRLQIIPLEYPFTDRDARNFNFNELVTKEALEYLAKISLEAYLNMEEHFSNYIESEREVNKYKITSNSILAFINDEEYIMSFIGEGVSTRFASEVHECYKKYCEVNNYRAIGRNKFYKEIEKSKLISLITVQHKQKAYTLNKEFYQQNSPVPQNPH